MEDKAKWPKHVALILDGNGRWAQKRGLPRSYGHKVGTETLEKIVFAAGELGLSTLTVYCFSTENWKRSVEEVGALMNLFRGYIRKLIKTAMERNTRCIVLGETSRFEKDLRDSIEELEQVTKNNTGMTFCIALNYGGRDEVVRGVRSIAERVKRGELSAEEITEKTISESLDTKGIPDPDLLIRTSGEMRLSNFLIWQCAYTEFYFTDTLWPDFSKEDLISAMDYYAGRDRRFGGVKTGKKG